MTKKANLRLNLDKSNISDGLSSYYKVHGDGVATLQLEKAVADSEFMKTIRSLEKSSKGLKKDRKTTPAE